MTKRSVDLTSAAAPGEGIPHPSYQGIRPMAALFKSLVFGIVQWVFLGCLWYVTVTFVFPCVAYLWITAGAGWTIVICAVGGFFALALIGIVIEKWENVQKRRLACCECICIDCGYETCTTQHTPAAPGSVDEALQNIYMKHIKEDLKSKQLDLFFER